MDYGSENLFLFGFAINNISCDLKVSNLIFKIYTTEENNTNVQIL